MVPVNSLPSSTRMLLGTLGTYPLINAHASPPMTDYVAKMRHILNQMTRIAHRTVLHIPNECKEPTTMAVLQACMRDDEDLIVSGESTYIAYLQRDGDIRHSMARSPSLQAIPVISDDLRARRDTLPASRACSPQQVMRFARLTVPCGPQSRFRTS